MKMARIVRWFGDQLTGRRETSSHILRAGAPGPVGAAGVPDIPRRFSAITAP